MIDFLYELPLWLSGTLMVAATIALACGGLALIRRFVLPRFHFGREHGHFGGAMVHSIMVFYALVAALISVNVWETHSDVSDNVSREASSVAALYRDASGYPEPTRTRLQGAIRDYVESVTDDDWPFQRRGEMPRGSLEPARRIQGTLTSFEPVTEGQKALHDEALRAYNLMIEARRLRVDALSDRLSGVMWAVIVIGAIASLFASYFFQVDDPGLHAVFVSLLALLIGLVIFMTFAMDHPYRGDLGVTAEPYQLIHDQLMKR